jgi:hypothetical protein
LPSTAGSGKAACPTCWNARSIGRVALDKVEGFVKAQNSRAVREHR